MGAEGQLLDNKSLKAIFGSNADWDEIAKDCIAFANACGGRLLIGIEDGQELPPSRQTVPDHLPDLLRRKLNERTVNLHLIPGLIAQRVPSWRHSMNIRMGICCGYAYSVIRKRIPALNSVHIG